MNFEKLRAVFAVGMLVLVFFGQSVNAKAIKNTAIKEVQFAGFSLMGSAESLKARFPYSADIFEEKDSDGQIYLNKNLNKALELNPPQHFKINRDVKAIEKSNIGMSIGLNYENVMQYRLTTGENLVVIQLGLQVLVVDFANLSLVAAYPITLIEYREITPKEADAETVQSLFKKLYLEEGEGSVMDMVSVRLKDLQPMRKMGNFLQVKSVSLGEKAKKELSDFSVETGVVEEIMAQSLSAYLSEAQQLSLLPYTKDYAIGNVMSARFADGRVFNITIPEADYTIDIRLQALVTKLYAQNAGSDTFVHGVYQRITVSEPLTKTTYVDAAFQKAGTSVYPTNQAPNEGWEPVYVENILAFYQDFSRQIDKPKQTWLKRFSKQKDIAKQMKSLQSVLEKCK